MATAENSTLVDRFEEFFRGYYDADIKELARGYPNERRSLFIDWGDLYRFDPDLADDYLEQPGELRRHAEAAIKVYDLPIDVTLDRAHIRLYNLPAEESPEIREIRAEDMNTFVQVRGIVRKATGVRPKIEIAAFECQLCGTMERVTQNHGEFQEPHECQGCERKGPFKVNFERSEFIDSQKLRVQESPEGLRGGETPEAIDVTIEDDITGEVTPGDHVSVTGVLRLEQQGNQQEKSPLFDFYMEGSSIEIDDEQFEEMDITDEDKAEIVRLSSSDDVYDQMVDSIAPSIWGYEDEKLALTLQLFSGVRKSLPDGSRIRGDLHILLIGDPGTGKCVSGDARILLNDGREKKIREIVESNLTDPQSISDGWWDEVDFSVPSMQYDGSIREARATKVWKREAPDRMYRIQTRTGRELIVTPSHPLFIQSEGQPTAVRADELREGMFIATPQGAEPTSESDALNVELRNDQDLNVIAPDGGTIPERGLTLRDNCTSDIFWDRIETIELVPSEDDWVYDLEIEETHNYISNGIVSHNSQLLSYIQNIAPRSVYTSGKGSSSAGLCVTGDTMIHTDRGFRRIEDIVSQDIPEPVTTETAVERDIGVQTFDRVSREMTDAPTSHAWRMPEKPCHRIETRWGKALEASANTPVLTCGEAGIEWTDIADVEPGDHVAVPTYDDLNRTEPSVRDFLDLSTEKIKLADDSIQFLRESLSNEFGTLRDAAAELGLSEDFIYLHLKNRHVPLEKLDLLLDAIDATREDVQFERLMIRHGNSSTLPDRFDSDLMYLLGLIFGDGDISLDRRGGNRGLVRLSNGDEAILERAADIFAEAFDKHPKIERQADRVPCIRVTSATIARLFANVGMESPKQDLALAPELTTAEHADAFLRGLMDADGSVSERDDGGSSVLISTSSDRLATQIQLMLESYGVRSRKRKRDRRGSSELVDGRTIESKHVQYFVELYGVDVDRYADVIGFDVTEKRRALERIVGEEHRRDETMPIGAALVATDGGVAGDYHNNVREGDNPSRARARQMLDDIDLGPATRTVTEVIDADLRWDVVASATNTGRKEVFDLTVPDTHNFVGNGIVTHNTAAAVRDDFGDGQQWSLEAGALVLADQGVAAVDELDKMAPDDRSAMHEALEQQQISIAKAGINATLKSRCSLLGAANPKYGRFDHFEPIGEQIDLEPALISRFDLIFIVTDQPDPDEDAALADHILTTNYAGELTTQREEMHTTDVSDEEVADVTQVVDPAIDPELLRKYVAHAKQSCHPRMTQEARDAIRDFYVDLRSRGADQDAPVPVTARKLEGLVRLAEASARVRLSDTVTETDADRVIEIVRSCLKDIGVDPETGEFDADIVEAGTSKSQRDRIKTIRKIIDTVQQEHDEGAPLEVVLEEAAEKGFDRSTAEHEIDKLKQKGEVYEPSSDILRTT